MAAGTQNNRTNLSADKLRLEWKKTWVCNTQMCSHQEPMLSRGKRKGRRFCFNYTHHKFFRSTYPTCNTSLLCSQIWHSRTEPIHLLPGFCLSCTRKMFQCFSSNYAATCATKKYQKLIMKMIQAFLFPSTMAKSVLSRQLKRPKILSTSPDR